jgi:hypothetical protein
MTASQIRGHFALISVSGVVSRSSGGVSVTNPNAGVFCVTVAGVDPTTSVATVTADYAHDATVASGTAAPQAVVEFDSNVTFCPTTAFEVRTFISQVIAGSATSTTTSTNQPFFLITPQ